MQHYRFKDLFMYTQRLIRLTLQKTEMSAGSIGLLAREIFRFLAKRLSEA